jgi:hypothetical protein
MSLSILPKSLRSWLRAYMALLFIALISSGVHLAKVGRDWPLGDWQINYEGGFVRRGLTGEIFLHASRLLHADPIYLIVLTAMSAYAALLIAIWKLLDRSSLRLWVLLLIVSPATFLFPLLSPVAGYHKETLYFASLAVLILLFIRTSHRVSDLVLTIYLSLIVTLLVLSHEPLVVYLPYLGAAIFIAKQDTARSIKILLLPALLAASLTALAVTKIGDANVVSAICGSIGANPQQPCSHAIIFLSQTKQQQTAMVLVDIATFHYLRNYSIFLVLSLVPICMGIGALYRSPKNRSAIKSLLLAALLSAVASTQLFRYGSDWGRWIYIHIISIMLLLMYVDYLHSQERSNEYAGTPLRLGTASLLFLFLYCTSWSLPGFGLDLRYGIDGKAAAIIHRHMH